MVSTRDRKRAESAYMALLGLEGSGEIRRTSNAEVRKLVLAAYQNETDSREVDRIVRAWKSITKRELMTLLRTGGADVHHAIASKSSLPRPVLTASLRIIKSPTLRTMFVDKASATHAHLRRASRAEEHPMVRGVAKANLRSRRGKGQRHASI